MSLEEWLGVLRAVATDVQAMRSYEAQLANEAARRELTHAWNRYERSGALARVQQRQARFTLRLFLQGELERPAPPREMAGDPQSWELVKSHLRRQLALLGRE